MEFFEDILSALKNGTAEGLIWALMALGVFISYRVLDFADLTAEGTVTLGGAIAISLLSQGVSVPIAILLSIVGGFTAGVITGVLHTKLKIPPILAGIITMTGLYSINLKVMGQASLQLDYVDTVIYSYLKYFINDSFIAKTLTTLIVISIIYFLIYWFFGTEIGIGLRATGMNQKMARAQGINTDLMIILGLGISNALIALSGALYSQSAKTANMDMGKGTIVIGLAAIIIGEVIFGKRSFKNWLISVILGSVILQILNAFAITQGLNPNDLKIIQAILITIVLALPVFKNIYKKLKKKVQSNA